MTTSHPHILVVDAEYLIGMDAERILAAAFNCVVVPATPATMQAHLDRQTFDVVIVEIAASLTATAERMAPARRAGAKIVFTSVFDEFRDGITGWEGIPVVLKPFDEADLIASVRSVLEPEG